MPRHWTPGRNRRLDVQLLVEYRSPMPSPANLRPSLSEHPFARQLDREQIANLEACAEECSFARGHYIWHQGEPDEDMYLIFSGQVALEISVPQQGSLQIEMVGEGDVLGGPVCYLHARLTSTPEQSHLCAPFACRAWS
jgi:hypothetical protein